jgi:hypothetical protein
MIVVRKSKPVIQPSQTSPGMTSRDSQGLQAERNGRKRPKFRVVKKLPTIPDIQEEEFLPASLVKQVKKRIVVRKKEAKCSTC